MATDTTQFPDEFPGKSVREIPELAALVDEISCDPMTWITIFRCRVSGEEWEEKYESKGHGEVPSVRRVENKRKRVGPERGQSVDSGLNN